MRAVTWTQVAQYIILIIAYMIPVVWLSVKQTGIPIPQIIYGKQLEKVTALEEKFIKDPKELEVRGHLQGARRRGQRQAEGPAGIVRRRQAEARRRRRRSSRPTTRRPSRSPPPKRRSPPIRRTPPPPRRSGPRMRGSPRARRRRCATPRRSPARTTPRATCRAGTSSRWCSA